MTEMTLTSVDGTKVAVRCTGHGSPLVLVHGAVGDVDTFALIEGLLGRAALGVGLLPQGSRRQRRRARVHSLDASVIDHLVDEMETALDAGDPDRALELFLPATRGHSRPRGVGPFKRWSRCGRGSVRVRLVPRELRSALRDGPDWRVGFDPPDVPTLYLHGEQTDAPMFPSPREVPDLLPNAQLHGLPRQRHLGFALDPSTFANAILEFTATHNT